VCKNTKTAILVHFLSRRHIDHWRSTCNTGRTCFWPIPLQIWQIWEHSQNDACQLPLASHGIFPCQQLGAPPGPMMGRSIIQTPRVGWVCAWLNIPTPCFIISQYWSCRQDNKWLPHTTKSSLIKTRFSSCLHDKIVFRISVSVLSSLSKYDTFSPPVLTRPLRFEQ
jgi:hypothetical protein